MKTLDSQTWHIMDATADDWESIDQIRPHVLTFHGHVSDAAIFATLRILHDQGLIKLMDDKGHSAKHFPKDPHAFWFSMTETGRQLWDAEGTKYQKE